MSGAAAIEAEAVVFAAVFDLDDDGPLDGIHEGPFDAVKKQDAYE